MGLVYVFADESGNFDFSRRGSAYFVLATVTVPDFAVGDALLQLRRDMGWRGVPLPGAFHATEDTQAVRDEVFRTLAHHEFRIDATILTKARTFTRLHQDDVRFYKTAWWLHWKYVAPRIFGDGDDLFVVSASLGTGRKKQALFHEAATEVVANAGRGRSVKTAGWSSACEPCLQVADYCCWAIQRKWERGDERSYELIREKIETEFLAY